MKKILAIIFLCASCSVAQDIGYFIDGTDDIHMCNVPSTWAKGAKTAWTIELWVKATTYLNLNGTSIGLGMMDNANQSVLNRITLYADAAPNGQHYPRSITTGLTSAGWLKYGEKITTTDTYKASGWFHSAWTYNGAVEILYINGEVRLSNNNTGTSTALTGGQERITPSIDRNWQPVVYDDFQVFSYAKTKREIKEDMIKTAPDRTRGIENKWDYEGRPQGASQVIDRSGKLNHCNSITGIPFRAKGFNKVKTGE